MSYLAAWSVQRRGRGRRARGRARMRRLLQGGMAETDKTQLGEQWRSPQGRSYTMEEPASGGACIQARVWDTSVQ